MLLAVLGLLLVDEGDDALVVEGDDVVVGGGALDAVDGVLELVVTVARLVALALLGRRRREDCAVRVEPPEPGLPKVRVQCPV